MTLSHTTGALQDTAVIMPTTQTAAVSSTENQGVQVGDKIPAKFRNIPPPLAAATETTEDQAKVADDSVSAEVPAEVAPAQAAQAEGEEEEKKEEEPAPR